MIDNNPTPASDQPSPPHQQPSGREIIEAKIVHGELPNWKVVHGRGKGFVIGGVRPPKAD
jgi:hypothetical protein